MNNPQKEINWAIEIAEKLPEKFQQSAFSELLHYALFHSDESKRSEKKTKDKLQTKIPEKVLSDGFPDLDLLAKQGNRDQHIAWAIAELYLNNMDVNNESIRKVLREKLAITPPGRQNTNRSLRNLTPKYITRTMVGKKYNYAPSTNFLEVFNDLEEE